MTRLAKGTNQPPSAQAGDQRMACSPSAGRLRYARCIHIGTTIAAPTTLGTTTTASTTTMTPSATPRPERGGGATIRSRITAGTLRTRPTITRATSTTAATARPSGGTYGRAHDGQGPVTETHCRPSQCHRPSGERWPADAAGGGVADRDGSGGDG